GVPVESRSVVASTELLGSFKARMIAKLLPHIAVHTEVLEKVVSLENSMVLDHPVILVRDERFQDRGANIRMIVSAKGVADIMQQGTDHILLIPTILVSSSCRL